MPWKKLFTAVPLLAASVQGACMTGDDNTSCSVEGAHFLADGGEAEICERFEREFYAALDTDRASADFVIALNVTKGGTITANVTETGGKTYPEVSIDVMDRNLNYSDVSQLAGAAAQIVMAG